MTTPVAFIIFNRPDTTEQVFAEIRRARPPKLYIIADGPRKPEEKALTDATRAVAEKVDWNCEVLKLYSETNLGCRKRVITGLNEVFDVEESAIILEDDCLPHPSFFYYCETLLNYYKDSDVIGTINGTCLSGTAEHLKDTTYTFSQFSIVWGWATTKKIWKLVDNDMKDWKMLKKQGWLKKRFRGQKNIIYGITNMFNQSAAGVDAWSYCLLFALLKNNKLNVYPNVNLISNIGFDKRATHTFHEKEYSNLPIGDTWICKYPKNIELDKVADSNIYMVFYDWILGENKSFTHFLKIRWRYLYQYKQKLFPGISFKNQIKRIISKSASSKMNK